MKRDERQRHILFLLRQESGISAGELAQRLNVSRMTIHRDLRSLNEQRRLLRIHGGAVARDSGAERAEESCAVCGSALLPHQLCQIRLPETAPSLLCCAACGLRQLLEAPASARLQVCDLISGRGLPATEAYFVLNSMAAPCCRPSMLSFADQQEATLFQGGFGGSIARLDEALEFLRIAKQLNAGGKPVRLRGRD